MEFGPQSLLVLRAIGALFGAYLLVSGFVRFRAGKLSRQNTALRWAVGAALVVVSVHPPTVNVAVSMLAFEEASFARMLTLLVISSLVLWGLLLRERDKTHLISKTLDRLIREFALSRADVGDLSALHGTTVLVAMPALNEADNLPAVLDRMPAEIDGHKVGVVVIDDGSDDGTSEVAREHGHVAISNPMRRGQGAASRLAYDLATRIGAKVVVTLDADGQHLPEDVPALVRPILDDDKDLVIGSRLLGGREKDSRFRLVGIYVNNGLINLLSGTRISDCSSGFKAIRVASLPGVRLYEDQFQAAETIISAANAGLRIGEVPITVKRRQKGISKKGRDLSYGFNFVRSVFKSWWR